MQSKNELLKDLNKIREEINSLRGQLTGTNREKEVWFSNKDKLSKDIKKTIIDVKQYREKRNHLTRSVKEDKRKRDELNNKIKIRVEELKTLSQEKKSSIIKHGIKKNPTEIKTEIDRLEIKTETEAIPFEEEKRILKKVKVLKKNLEGSEILSKNIEAYGKLSMETNSLKKEAQNIHKEIQRKARESQKLHVSLIKDSREIDRLKDLEKGAFSKFLVNKSKFNDTNKKLKEKLKSMADINSEIKKIDKGKKDKILKDKEQQIHEKIKRGQKITTEDLLIFQQSIIF